MRMNYFVATMDTFTKQNKQFTNKTYRNGKTQQSRFVVFAQPKQTRFAHMTMEQLQEKSRDNKLRRCILQQLILESNFAATGSKFFQLCVRGVAPCFLKTDGPRREFKIRCADGIVCVKVNLLDREAQAIWQRVQPVLVCDAQSLFGVDLNVKLSDPNLVNLIAQISRVLTGFNDNSSTLKNVAVCALALWNFMRGKNDMISFGILLTQICLQVDLVHDIMAQAYEYLKDHILGAMAFINGKLFSQGDCDPMTSLITVITVLFGTVIMKNVPKGSQIDECVAGAIKIGNLTRGLSSAWTGIEKVVLFIFEKIYVWMYGVPSSVTEMSKFVAGTQEWYERVQKLVTLATPDEISVNSEFCTEIESLYRDGLRMNAMAQEYKLDVKIMSAFQTHLRVVNSYYDKAQSSGAFRGGPRVEPIVIHMHGESGVGKSGMTYPLAIDILKVEGIPGGDYSREIYMRAIEQDFWDGYRNQRVCIYDDFGQMRDSQSKPNLEFMEVIRTGNLAPYPLHMASLEEKAKTYFKSRAIILTSNEARFTPESLSHPEAVRRRVDLSVDVHIRAPFQKQDAGKTRLDPMAVERILGEKISMDVYELWLCDPQTGHHMHRNSISYDAFRKMVQELYRNRFEKSAALFDFLQKRADSPIEAQVLTDVNDENVLNHMRRLKFQMKTPQSYFGTMTFAQFLRFYNHGFADMINFFDLDSNMSLARVLKDLSGVEDERMLECWMKIQEISVNLAWRNNVEERVRIAWMRQAQERHYSINGHLPLYQRSEFLMWMVDDVEMEVPTWSKRTLDILKAGVAEAKTWFENFKAKVLKVASEHPWLTGLACVLPLVCVFWYTSTSGSKRSYHARKLVSELGNSGDFTSVKKPVVRTELSNSGDAVTIRKPIVRTEGMSLEESMKLSLKECDSCGKNPCACWSLKNWAGVKLCPKCKEEHIPGDCETHANMRQVGQTVGNALAGPLLVAGAFAGWNGAKLVSNYICGEGECDGEDENSVPLESQLQVDANAFAISKKILNSTYNIELKIDEKYSAKLKIVMLVGRIGITVAHFLPYIQKSTEVRIWNQTKKEGHYFPTSSLKISQVFAADGAKKDQILVAFPSTLHDHPDLLSSVADNTTMSSFQRVSAVLVTPSDIGPIMRFGMITAHEKGMREYVDGTTPLIIRDRYEYTTLETTKGDCGSVLVGIGSKLTKKILGIHCAGTVGLGVATPLNIRDIRGALSHLPLDAQISLCVDDALRECGTGADVKLPEGNFLPVGKAIYRVSGATKTQLRPSLIAGQVVPVTTAPSALRTVRTDTGIVDPMMCGLKKAGAIPPFLDDKLIDAAINDMKRIINSNIDARTCRVLTNMEAVTGIEGNEFIGPIKRSSSAGFPWMQLKVGPGKTKWLGSIEYKLDPEVEECMEKRVEMAKNNQRMTTVWTDTLKDERRPLEKVLAGKTRVFSAGPMDYTLVFRKYFLAFAGHVAENRIGNEVSVGTNPYSNDWSRTAAKVLRKGPKVIAGDFSNFDGTLVLQILSRILDIVQDYYDDGEENAQIRRVLWREITNSIHVNGDDVYMWTHSQPSGCPITAILNSIYNSVSMRYVWQLIMTPHGMGTMADFNKHVSMVSYGDDNLVNISDSVIEYFNQVTIASGYAEIGMVYTDEAKSGQMVPFRSLDECSYLKRRFVFDNEEMQWIAPLDISVVLEMANWIRGDLDQEASTNVNIEMSCFELTLHGRETFEQWVREYHCATARFANRPMILTFDEYRSVEAQKYGRMC